MAAKRHTLEVYNSRSGWRYRVKSRNGRVIIAATESYENRKDALAALCAALNDLTLFEDAKAALEQASARRKKEPTK